MKKIGKNIKQRREYLGLTQAELTRRSGLTPAAISLIENGMRGMNLNSFAKIAEALSISMDLLYYNKPIEWINAKHYKKAMQKLDENIKKAVNKFHKGFII